MDSWCQPGNSSHATATQRLRRTSRPKASGGGRSSGLLLGAGGGEDRRGAGAGTGAVEGKLGAVSLGAGKGGVAQATNKAKQLHNKALGAARSNKLKVRADTGEDNNMWWILLEALAAGLILVLIVWWTMSGRPSNHGDEEDQPDKH